jgi:histidine triad (HIT) family protein
MPDCFFCDQQNGLRPPVGGEIYGDEHVGVTHMLSRAEPTYLGYLAVQTRRHVHHWADLTDAEASTVGLVIARVSRAMEACLGADSTYVVYYAEVVPHFHALVTARYPGTPEAYWRGNVYDWPNAPKGDSNQVAEVCEKLRTYLTRPQELESLSSHNQNHEPGPVGSPAGLVRASR